MNRNNQAIADNLHRLNSGELTIEELLNSGQPDTSASNQEGASNDDDKELTLEELSGGASDITEPDEDGDVDDPNNQDDFSLSTDDASTPTKRRLTSAERNAKRREKEAALNARIEHLEAEIQRKNAKDSEIEQRVAEHQSHFQGVKNYQLDNEVEVRKANILRIQEELVQANMNYDSAKQVELQNRFIEEKFSLRDAETKREFLKNQQQTSTTQPQRTNVDQELFTTRVNDFVSREDHKWMGTEFNAQGQPLTEDAQRTVALISRLANAGGDVRTKSFWDTVDIQLRDTLPARYVKRYGQKNSPNVAGGSAGRPPASAPKITNIDQQAFDMLQQVKRDRPFVDKAAEKAFFIEYRKNLIAAAKRNS